jgi:hypothetical protein
MTRRRRPSKPERELVARLFAPAERAPEPTLWQRMAHQERTCGGCEAGCPLCLAEAQ